MGGQPWRSPTQVFWRKRLHPPTKKEPHNQMAQTIKRPTVVHGGEFCSNCGMRAVLQGPSLGTQASLSWPTSEGLRVVSSHLYCFLGRREGSGHQSGNHQASRSGRCPTCARWKPAGRRGCYTGMRAAPWITRVPFPPRLGLALSPRCQIN